MRTIKKIWRCTDCKEGPCFHIMHTDNYPTLCSVDAMGDNRVPWEYLETIYQTDGEIDKRVIKEILDA